MVNLPGYRTENIAWALTQYQEPGKVERYLSGLFDRAADYFWKSPEPGQIIERKGQNVLDRDRCVILGIETDPESGTSFLVTSPDAIPGQGYAYDSGTRAPEATGGSRSGERTRQAVRNEYRVAEDSPPPTQRDDLTAFRYSAGAILNGDGIRAGMQRHGNVGALHIPETVTVTGAGSLPDGREYYVMRTNTAYPGYPHTLVAARETVDSDPGIRRLNAPSAARPQPAP